MLSHKDAIHDFLVDFMRVNGYAPTTREIMSGCGITSSSVVRYNLQSLRDDGVITLIPAVSRGIVLRHEHGRYSDLIAAAKAIIYLDSDDPKVVNKALLRLAVEVDALE